MSFLCPVSQDGCIRKKNNSHKKNEIFWEQMSDSAPEGTDVPSRLSIKRARSSSSSASSLEPRSCVKVEVADLGSRP